MQLSPRIWMVGSGQVGLSNPMDCHVYLVGGPDACYLIDGGVGVEPERILRHVYEAGIQAGAVKGILITHAHSDHAGGARALSEAFSTEVLACEAEAKQLAEGTPETLGLVEAKVSACYPPDYEYPHHRATVIPDGWQDAAGDWSIRAVVSPGHSIGSTAYLLEWEGRRDLFSGDIVFFGGKLGLLNCWGSSAEAYRRHFHRVAELNITGLYPGHQLFTHADGQQHLDRAVEALKGVFLPDHVGPA